MKRKDYAESLLYLDKEPDVKVLTEAYEETINELSSYFSICRESYKDRRNDWPGKSRDLKKHGADAFPWGGASDLETYVIEERIGYLVSMFINALRKSNVIANPVQADDLARAEVVSSFMKWMISSEYIPRFYKEAEIGANYMLERGMIITYVGWIKKSPTFKQILTLDAIAQQAPQIVEIIKDEELEAQAIEKGIAL